MDFVDEVRQFAKKIEAVKDHLKTEEATKHSLIMPFLQLLGYDVFDPAEVVPEFTADVGTKKGEKVDYAIMSKGTPSILIEAKNFGDPLTQHDSQLYRYFSVTKAKFAILTNGSLYKFFSDLQEPNKMDETPFFEFDFLNIREALVPELRKFHKENFDTEALYSDAANLKYIGLIRSVMDRELKDPSPDYCRFFLKEIQPHKFATQNVLDKFKPLIKRALTIYINDLLSERLKSAIATTTEETTTPGVATSSDAAKPGVPDQPAADPKSQIVTTAEELEGYFIIKSILREVTSSKRVTLKDNLSYCSILLDNNVRRWVCRLYFHGTLKAIVIAGADKTEKRYNLRDVEDIYQHREELLAVAGRYPSA